MSTEGKKIEIKQSPIIGNQPSVAFNKQNFSSLIWTQGYDVIIEKALRCPCKTKGSDNLSNCKNCGGSGWFFINPKKTKAIIHSQNQTTKFKDWSEENIGNANISVDDDDRLAFMDRITILQGESLYSQTVFPKPYKGVIFAFLDYEPKSVSEVFLFHKADEKLVVLENISDYKIVDSKIILDKKFNGVNDITLSIRYIHAPQYYVIDVRRDVMVANTFTPGNSRQKSQMPISAIGRRAHYVLDKNNYNTDLIFDNSVEIDSCENKNFVKEQDCK